MYVRVFAPDGEPFEVSRDRADYLILECGWTQTPPITEATAAAVKKPANAGTVADSTSE